MKACECDSSRSALLEGRGIGRRLAQTVSGVLSLGLAFLSSSEAASQRVPRDLGMATGRVITTAQTYPVGTIVILTKQRTLELVLSRNRAIRYTIGVGRDGFRWRGVVSVGRKAEWPDWRPPAEMKGRTPELPALLPAGPFNPMGARGIYLYQGDADTLYRIHGTNEQSTVGAFASSGCFRMSNTDVIDLYKRVKIGATVVVK
ncbi:L,D-transpeptidase [Sinorhizobium numidicum]|uniref:L,D-transpeptidase n=1 Tax=Sinorhizobium numidicum TaxID=680248 RepID=A0ABY8CR49_9HYPH|nr:L,D-transpeptidase [Sinorhizobium numidicum]WEX75130.1 L,D-transpeptidase [Sinorhizobium numidicum]WEX81124.1 L,D-transpeptidase [Sinorhizobium numidicum]